MQGSGHRAIEGFDAPRRADPPGVEDPGMVSQLAEGFSTQGAQKPRPVETVEPGPRVERAGASGKVIRNADRRRRVERRVCSGASKQHQQDVPPEREANPEQGTADPGSQSGSDEERVTRIA